MTTAFTAGTLPLKEAAGRVGLSFGSAVNADALKGWPQLAELVRFQCAVVTPELALKWALLEPTPGGLQFARMDAIADFARANGLRVRGHTLVWRRSVPEWGRAELHARPDWNIVKRFFASVMPRYGDVIDEWDVVNEPIDVEGAPAAFRENPLKQAFGTDYIRRALEEARLYAPHARLMINEFGLEASSAASQRKRETFLRLVEHLKISGAPLDGVGLQSHLDLNAGPFAAEPFAQFLSALASMNLRITLSELDVKERDYASPAAIRDREVATATTDYLAVALDQPAVSAVLTWGLSDRGSWLNVTDADRARFPGAWRDGTGPGLNRGLPYSAALQPKPMRAALLAAFSERKA